MTVREGVIGALNRGFPGNGNVKLGTRLAELIRLVNDLRTAMLNRTHTKAGLAIGTDKTKVLIANTVQFSIAGVAYTKTTAEIAFTATTHDITAHATLDQERVYLYVIDSAGTVTIVASDQASGAGNAEIPATPANKVAIGYLRLVNAAGVTIFDATTDELDEAHLTDTYVDLAANPTDIEAALSELFAA